MKICVAQTRPVKGEVQINAEAHTKFIQIAVSNAVDIIIFPELSLTGYEPTLAKALAVSTDDKCLDNFQTISDIGNITIGVGMPVKSDQGILVGMIILQPDKPRQTYFKQYIHPDEEPFFTGGHYQHGLLGGTDKIALAICYELSIPQHSEKASQTGAEIYVASVAKTVDGVDKAITTLSGIASKHSMLVLMANCVGECDETICGGKTSAWNREGVLLGQLSATNEGLLIMDTNSLQVMHFNL